MVDANAALEQLGELEDLWQAAVRTLQTGHTLADEVMDVALLHGRRQIQARQHGCRLQTNKNNVVKIALALPVHLNYGKNSYK